MQGRIATATPSPANMTDGGRRRRRRPYAEAARLLLLVVCGVLLTVEADLSSDGQALLAFVLGLEAAGTTLLNWGGSNGSTPCGWVGVQCNSAGNAVVAVKLPAAGLYGSIKAGTVSRLASLEVLSLRSNHLKGPLPPDLLNCTRLRKLFLQNNLLSGAIPAFTSSLTPSLSSLDLSFNLFSSSIPPSLSSLSLRILLLQHNNLSGPIPPDLPAVGLRQLNLSYNLLTGPVPSQLILFPASSFVGNAALCGPPTTSACATTSPGPAAIPSASPPPPPHAATKSSLSMLDIALIVVADVAIVLLVAACCCLCRLQRQQAAEKQEQSKQPAVATEKEKASGGSSRWVAMPVLFRKKGEAEEEEEGEDAEEAAVRKEQGSNTVNKLVFFKRSGGVTGEAEEEEAFDLEDLLRASAEVLGKGGYGTAYRAVLEGGQRLVVKRLKQVAVAGRREFEHIVEAAGRLRHPHLLPLRAYYFSKDEKLLVYDYLPSAPLSSSLYGPKKRELPWETRLKTAVGAAKGLAAIHAAGPKSTHGSVKSSNIILDPKKGAVLTDYGLIGLFGSGTVPARMAGYRPPEMQVAGPGVTLASQKADVYAFGVVLLELLTARQASTMAEEEGMDLPRWVNAVVREEWTAEVFDKDLLRQPTIVEDELVQLLHLALACSATSADKRPVMAEVLDGLLRIRPQVVAETTLSSSTSTASASPPPPPSDG